MVSIIIDFIYNLKSILKMILPLIDYHRENGFHNLYSFSVNGHVKTDEKVPKENLWFWNSGRDGDSDDVLNTHRNSIKYEDNYTKKHFEETNGVDLINANNQEHNFGILV